MCCFPLESFESLETVNYIFVLCHTKFGKVETIQKETVLLGYDPGETQKNAQHFTELDPLITLRICSASVCKPE